MGARRLQFHGFVIVLICLAMGLVVAAAGPGVRGRQWLGAHVTGLMVGILLVAASTAWPNLRLGPRALKTAWFTLVSGAWAGLLVLGLFVPIMAVPQAQAAPNLPAPAAWTNGVVAAGLVYVTVTLLTAAGLFVAGLRPVANEEI
jgi:hypothetical protein